MRFPKFVRLLPVLVLPLVNPAAASIIHFQADLDPANEVPPHNTLASGFATLTADTVAATLTLHLEFADLSAPASAGHIHFAPVGVNGPIILPFLGLPAATSGTFDSVFTAANLINQVASGISTFDQLLAEMLAGNEYVNLHNSVFPGGEIRGQIELVPEPAPLAVLALGAIALIGAAVYRRRSS